jgi:octaprenyl-diphosphate synthase
MRAMIDRWEEYIVFEKGLKKFLSSVETIPRLKKALKYAIDSGGKRTRPLIVLLSGKLCGGDYDRLMNLAISVELIHTASLVHDDVIDKAERRRRKKALHKEYDISLAIVLGDWLISKSVELTSVYGEEVISDFSKVGMMMSEGEIRDIYSIKEEFSEEDYFKCIETKTASLFAYAAKTACKVVCKNVEAAKALFEYGYNLGMAYQLVDDLLEYLKAFDDKISEFESRTLPQIYESAYGKERGVKKILELIRDYTIKSFKALSFFEECEAREKLREIVRYMTYDMMKSYTQKTGREIAISEAF